MAFSKRNRKQNIAESPDVLFRELPRRNVPDVLPLQRDMMRLYAKEGQDKPDIALQLPTGSGKTLVGLLIAEWRRRKNNEKIVYLCPTKQLVNQVVEQAETKFGLSVVGFTGSSSNYNPQDVARYSQGMSIAITTYSSVFNTNPFFKNPDVIIIDDAHAAENYIAKLWSLEILKFDPDCENLYKVLCDLIKPHIDLNNYLKLTDDGNEGVGNQWVDKLPSDIFYLIKQDLIEVIDEYVKGTHLRFPWSMIRDHLDACHFYFSAQSILIRPLLPPTWTHNPFNNATQRIFMSATLGEGGDLERLTGRKNIHRIAISEGRSIEGVGRRFFIFPSYSLSDEDSNLLTIKLAESSKRSLVLVPSNKIAYEAKEFFKLNSELVIYDAEDIEESKNNFVNDEHAVAIIANRYDGIDFPKDECRLLIIEGLPQTVNLQEQFLMSRMGANILFKERIQTRVIQAIGRCTRSLEDYSAIVVKGVELVDYLTDIKKREYLHPELQAEIEFGVQQSMDAETISDFADNFHIFLENGEEWEEVNKEILESRDEKKQLEFPEVATLASVVSLEIDYVKALWKSDIEIAISKAEEILTEMKLPELQGYRALWGYLAGSSSLQAKEIIGVDLSLKAQEYFLNVRKSNSSIPWMSSLYRRVVGEPPVDSEINSSILVQIENIERVFQKIGVTNNRKLIQAERFIIEGLESENQFEEAHRRLGEMLGFETGKVEADASPDPWWQLDDICFVFEDHANAQNDTLDATKARQASSHPNWMRQHIFKDRYVQVIPVLLSPVSTMRSGASPHVENLSYWNLNDFKIWANNALTTLKEIKVTFQEPGILSWRNEVVQKLVTARLDIINIRDDLLASKCSEKLKVI